MNKLYKKLKTFYFYNIKLSHKLIISYWLLLAIPTIAVSLFLYGEIYDLVIENTIRSEQLLAEQSVNTVEATIRQVTNSSNIIRADSYLNNLLSFEDASIYDNYGTSLQTASFLKSVSSLMDGNVIKTVKLYLDTPYEPLYKDSTFFLPMTEAKGTYWYGILKNSKDTALHCPTFYLSPSEAKYYGNMAYVQKISYGSNSSKTAAYLAVYYEQSTLDDILLQEQSRGSNVTYIINSRDSIAATSNLSLTGTYYMNYSTLEASIGQSNTFAMRTALNQQVYISYYPINNTDWRLVSVIPATPLLKQGNRFMSNFVLLYLIFLAFAFLLAAALAHSIAKRISSVSNGMKSVRSGKLQPISIEHGSDEIGSLVDTYNYMVEKIDELLAAQAASANQLRTSEFNALQAQINPHFLYNTLDMINWLSQSGQSSEVTEAVQNLSKFYKLTLSKKDTLSSIEDELKHVSLYVRLQNMRYNDKIDFLIDVPDEIMEYEIPKLTFQPIVENSIQHGILEKESKEGTIVLTAWTENLDIIFLISDNGVGMTSEILKNILSKDAQNTTSSGEKRKGGSNIGVYNTHQRLSLLYGSSYGLSYESTPGTGTDVTIRIPAKHIPHHTPQTAATISPPASDPLL